MQYDEEAQIWWQISLIFFLIFLTNNNQNLIKMKIVPFFFYYLAVKYVMQGDQFTFMDIQKFAETG